MITEKQQIKVHKLYSIYRENHEELVEEVNEAKLIEVLKMNKWNITNAIKCLFTYHNEIVLEKSRIKNLPKNVVRPFDCQGHDEVWCKFYKCPNCNAVSLTESKENYCSNCGIKVDWSEIK